MFCPECGSIVVNKKGKMVCSSCGISASVKKISEKSTKELKEVAVLKDEPDVHPRTKENCPKCGNNEAYYWMVQTRGADESPTKFYKCTTCKHQWRDYS